ALVGPTSLLVASSGPSHSTHFVADKGPHISLDETGCYVCHADADQQCGEDAPFFKSGTDGSGDGKYDLSETDVCNPCHSPGVPFDGVAMAKENWELGVYGQDGTTLTPGKEMWCISCHDAGTSVCDGVGAPDISGDNTTYGYYVNGHRSRPCSDCHDLTVTHVDGDARTYAYNFAQYAPGESGVAYAAGYRLKSMGADIPGGYNESVPLMIPTNFNTTFAYSGQDIMDNAARLCFSCHDSTEVFDEIPDGGIDTNFKSAMPNPPRDYSFSLGDMNQHVWHTIGMTIQSWDSDWDDTTTGPGPGPGYDTLTTCSSCHNVHGAAGADGSTNEPMIRDGSLAGRTGYGFSYLISGGYPTVTSIGASLPISVGAVFRNGNAMCGGTCHQSTPPGPLTPAYDATGSGSGTYLEYYRAVGTFNCSDCHAYAEGASHPTHADGAGKGVDLGCFECHDSDGHVNDIVDLPDGPLSTTTACDACHSEEGPYGGVTMAKDNWTDGVYDAVGGGLKDGKETWCATCHDQDALETVIQIDDFEGYGSDGELQEQWGVGTDARIVELATDDDPDVSQYMNASIRWTRSPADNYGAVERVFTPYVDLGGMQYVSFYLKIDEPLKFERIKVRLTNSAAEQATLNYYTSLMVPGVWRQIWLARTSFNNDISWEEITEIQFRIFENSPSESYEESICIDNVSFSRIEPRPGGGGPAVVGDDQAFGFYVTGHGRSPINHGCDDCHDPTTKHIDGEHRTYSATADYGANPEQTYRNGYRLNDDMAIPRGSEVGTDAFKLCTNESCHPYSQVVSDDKSNFRKEGIYQFHEVHLENILIPKWDSDWDATPWDPDNYLPTQMGGPIDSGLSCPACHNVHGTPSPAMARHGELISSPGTSDKVPALDFKWFEADELVPGEPGDQTWDLSKSRYGSLIAGPNEEAMDNQVCTDCHSHGAEWIDDGYAERYYRLPNILEVIDVWTTDDFDNIKDDFLPDDPVRYHVKFRVSGSGSYIVKTGLDTKAESTSGTYWKTDLVHPEESLGAGDYEWSWDETIPASADHGSTAQVIMRIKLKFEPDGAIIRVGAHGFNVD
ncbi:MAG: cytochrome c3 family protein, partial [Deltaproteobacteria bacterium]|nr:cytochrome c3 family protein [Deltaproteobacteria bacterium]